MYNAEEQALSEMRTAITEGCVPEQVEDRIRQGMERAKKELERRRRRKWRSLWTGIAAACVVLVLAGSIRVSPAFAAFVRDIPGMNYFVKLIADDRGLQDAVANEWMQPVGLTDAHDGMRLTVDGIIADERRAVIFYTVKHENENFAVRLSDIEVLSGDRKPLHGFLSYGYEDIGKIVGSKGEAGIRRGRVDVGLPVGEGAVLPDELIFSTNLMAEDTRSYVPFDEKSRHVGDDLEMLEPRKGSPSANWEVRIQIDKAKFAAMKKVYPIGQTIDVKGNKLTFVQATVYPLQIVLEVKTDPSNRMKYLDFADLRLVDEHGTALKPGSGGSGGTDINQRFIYFESNYFDPPEKLYAEGELFRAWDTADSKVVIDLDQEKLVTAPDDRLKLERVSRSASVIQLHFSLTGIDEADNLIYSILNTEYTDGDGKSYSMSEMGLFTAATSTSEQKQTSSYVISNKPYKQPLTFQVDRYPGYLREKFRVQIK